MGRFFKCQLVTMSSGPGTDIRLKSPACSQFEKGEEIKVSAIPYWKRRP